MQSEENLMKSAQHLIEFFYNALPHSALIVKKCIVRHSATILE